MAGRHYLWYISGGIHSKDLRERSKGIHVESDGLPAQKPMKQTLDGSFVVRLWLDQQSILGEIHRSPVDSLRKHQHRGTLILPWLSEQVVGHTAELSSIWISMTLTWLLSIRLIMYCTSVVLKWHSLPLCHMFISELLPPFSRILSITKCQYMCADHCIACSAYGDSRRHNG